MTTKEQQIYVAIAGLAQLNEIDLKFREYLGSVGTTVKDLGSLMTHDSEISATCLGINLKVVARPVAINGTPVAIEYVFGEEREEGLAPYWRMYLDSFGSFYADAECQKRLWDYNNMYIVKFVLVEIGVAMLSSGRFAPTP